MWNRRHAFCHTCHIATLVVENKVENKAASEDLNFQLYQREKQIAALWVTVHGVERAKELELEHFGNYFTHELKSAYDVDAPKWNFIEDGREKRLVKRDDH